jgi:hypothetical protein
MAALTTAFPLQTGEPEADIAELRSWACSLVAELRNLIYKLDASNVIEAATVKATGIRGTLNPEQLPDCISFEIGAENGITYTDGDDTAAQIYCDSTGLHIKTSKDVYVNDTKIE